MKIVTMPEVFVISPNALASRRQVCEDHLKDMGVSYQVFNGLFGDSMNIKTKFGRKRYSQYDTIPYGNINSSTLCLGINHWCLWQHIFLSGIDMAIIFEDDVLLPDNFMDRFMDIMAGVPDDWDVIYLGLLFPERIESGKIMAVKIAPEIWKHIGTRTWDGTCDGMHAYMVSATGAKKMTQLKFSLREQIDRYVSFDMLPYLKTYIWKSSEIKQRTQVLRNKEDKGEWLSSVGNCDQGESDV